MTPLMQQYHAIKVNYPEALVLFQVGDFYELFYDDARAVSSYLGIVLTKRGTSDGEPIPLCGVPCHTFDHYLIRLVQGGFRVVVCDQRGDVVPGKLVERVVTRVFTPGILTDAKLLDAKQSTVLAVHACAGGVTALIFVELITGTLQATVIPSEKEQGIAAELSRFAPRELIVNTKSGAFAQNNGSSALLWKREGDHGLVIAWLATYVEPSTRALIEASPALITGFCLLYSYLAHHAPDSLASLRSVILYQPADALMLDAVTQRTLELVRSAHDGTTKGTLHEVLDYAVTGMGSRCIKQWILQPLRDRVAIERRLDYVAACVDAPTLRESLAEVLRSIGDVERVIGRLALKRGTITDYRALARALSCSEQIEMLVAQTPLCHAIKALMHYRSERAALYALLSCALGEEALDVYQIAPGYDVELDRLRTLLTTGEQSLLALELREQQATGITTLKLRFTDLYGYAFEISKQHRDQLPERFQHVQSLAQRDRFTTDELRKLEADIRYAQQHAQKLERELLVQLGEQLYVQRLWLRACADELMMLDAYVGLARAASEHRYVRPTLVDERRLVIEQGRHPVVEYMMQQRGSRDRFIANSLRLHEDERMWMITGPNMGGKSTFLRQAALIVLMAHMGSFVPANAAFIPLCDRIFTRVGASDHVAGGKSTFLVEMEEISLICREATAQSLVVVDEIGRGTSTYDGMAIAQAVMEYLAATTRSYTLFATHYHELAAAATPESGIALYHAASRSTAQGVTLLHAIRPGCAEGSFGIAVARTAALPQVLIARAEILMHRMHSGQDLQLYPSMKYHEKNEESVDEVRVRLRALDSDAITPRQALDVLIALKELAETL